jgi:hypothetical protein
MVTTQEEKKSKTFHAISNQEVPFSPLGGSCFSKESASAAMLALRGPTCALLELPGSGIKPPPKCTLYDKGGRICNVPHVLRTCHGMAGLQKTGALPTRCMLWILKLNPVEVGYRDNEQ